MAAAAALGMAPSPNATANAPTWSVANHVAINQAASTSPAPGNAATGAEKTKTDTVASETAAESVGRTCQACAKAKVNEGDAESVSSSLLELSKKLASLLCLFSSNVPYMLCNLSGEMLPHWPELRPLHPLGPCVRGPAQGPRPTAWQD